MKIEKTTQIKTTITISAEDIRYLLAMKGIEVNIDEVNNIQGSDEEYFCFPLILEVNRDLAPGVISPLVLTETQKNNVIWDLDVYDRQFHRARKIAAIKNLRDSTKCGLKEALDTVNRIIDTNGWTPID